MSPDLIAIAPAIVIAIGGIGFLLAPFLRSARILGMLTLILLLIAFNLTLRGMVQQSASSPLFGGMFFQDRFARFFQIGILAAMMLVTLGVMGYAREQFRRRREVYALLLLITVGMLILVGANNLALIYVGLETISILSYLLTGMLRRESLSIEAGLKYFLFGSLATGAFLYGLSLLYGLTGAMDLPTLALQFPKAMGQAPALGAVILFLLVAGFGFKIALAPFHMWAPDAYEGAPTPIAAFISVAPKLAGFAILARLLLTGISAQVALWPVLLGVLAILTMTVGNVVALAQTNVKRLLAYSSIAHAGTMAIGLAVATPLGLTATLYYLIAYALMNMGAFLGVIAVGNATGREDLGAFNGLSSREPFLALMIALSFLSLAGVPPLAGFFAKMWIFGAALKSGAVWLAVIAAVNSVISLFYYMKVVKAMYLDPAPASSAPMPRSRTLRLGLILCTVGLLLIGLFPGHWLLIAGSSLPIPVHAGDLPWLPVR